MGYRNGFEPPRTIKTTLGPVELRRPKLRHAHWAFCDQLFGVQVSRTNAPNTLVISAWVRRLSDRDVEALLKEVFGDEAKSSRLTASRICQRLRAEFDAWKRRELSGSRIDDLYLDGSYCHDAPEGQSRASARRLGHRHLWQTRLLGPRPGREQVRRRLDRVPHRPHRPGDVCAAPRHLRRRQGLGAATECCFSASKHQRCTIHVACNVLAKVPKHAQADVKGDDWAILNGIEGSGDEALAEGRRRPRRFIATWKPLYSAASACVEDNLEALLAYLAFPAEHHNRIRHSNLLERTFGETRRRVKGIGRLPREQSCPPLVWAVLDRASNGWRGLAMTPEALRQLQDLRRQPLEPAKGLHAPADEPPVIDADTAAASHHIRTDVRGRLHQR